MNETGIATNEEYFMSMKKSLAAVAALSMVAVQPAMAANSAQKLSLGKVATSNVRASTLPGKSKAAGGISTIAIVAGVVVAVGLVILISDGDSDSN